MTTSTPDDTALEQRAATFVNHSTAMPPPNTYDRSLSIDTQFAPETPARFLNVAASASPPESEIDRLRKPKKTERSTGPN